ncbi:MAG: HK97 family phage prohead protease [Tannerella sp.]|jgi:HK97 family phage prohead protease|nr:HK97 family phage prohead protease [Tannerella sp.]
MDKKTFVLSDGTRKNTHGFMLDLNGLDLGRFRGNPVMLYAHDRRQVIGRWINIRLEDNRLLADADFDDGDDFAAKIAAKVDKGYLRGASVGIHIKKMADTDTGTIATAAELLEASIVSIPSDAGAVVLYDDRQDIVSLEAIKNNFNNILNRKKMDDNNVTNLTAQVTALTADVAARDTRIAELEATVRELEKKRVESLINNAVAAKKIGADEKETYVALAAKDYEGVKKILCKMQGAARVAGQLETGRTATTLSWDELDRAGRLAALKADNPEEYRRVFNEKFK